jgi:hypothetical protein
MVAAAAAAACKRTAVQPPDQAQVASPSPSAAPKAKASDFRQMAGEPLVPEEPAENPPPSPAQAGPSEPRVADTLNGDPNGIRRDTLNRSVQAAMRSFSNCFTGAVYAPSVGVSFQAEPTGKASQTLITGAPPEVEHCIRGVVDNMRFPSFEGRAVQVDLPLTFQRTGAPAPPPSGAAPSQAANPSGGPPLFMEP